MNKSLKQILILMFILVVLILPYLVFAQSTMDSPLDTLKKVQPKSGYAEATDEYVFARTLGLAVRILLSLLGVIFIIMMIYGGYHYMTAGGDESKVEKSRKTIQRAIIGLIILVSSYAIWNFIRVYMEI